MMTLSVNGEEKILALNSVIADALQQWGYQCEEIAVAVNNEFIPRSHYQQHQLAADDRVDIVAPMQGG